jgi:hypothetical protein
MITSYLCFNFVTVLNFVYHFVFVHYPYFYSKCHGFCSRVHKSKAAVSKHQAVKAYGGVEKNLIWIYGDIASSV